MEVIYSQFYKCLGRVRGRVVTGWRQAVAGCVSADDMAAQEQIKRWSASGTRCRAMAVQGAFSAAPVPSPTSVVRG